MSMREKILCGSALVSVCALLTWNTAIPIYNDYQKKRATISALETRYEKLKSSANREHSLTAPAKSKWSATTPTQNPANVKMSKGLQMTAIMDIIRRTCSAPNAKLIGVTMDASGRAQENAVRIVLETDYWTTAKLMKQLSALRLSTYISALHMSSDPLSEKRNMVVNLTLKSMDAI